MPLLSSVVSLARCKRVHRKVLGVQFPSAAPAILINLRPSRSPFISGSGGVIFQAIIIRVAVRWWNAPGEGGDGSSILHVNKFIIRRCTFEIVGLLIL